jgi:hypothetical protein
MVVSIQLGVIGIAVTGLVRRRQNWILLANGGARSNGGRQNDTSSSTRSSTVE